jgi:hypothetical protein
MRRWLFLLGGPLIWSAHFSFIYLVASISVVATGETNFLARALIIGSGIAAAAGCAVLFVSSRDRRDESAFFRAVSRAGAALAGVAVIWQTLPALAPI